MFENCYENICENDRNALILYMQEGSLYWNIVNPFELSGVHFTTDIKQK